MDRDPGERNDPAFPVTGVHAGLLNHALRPETGLRHTTIEPAPVRRNQSLTLLDTHAFTGALDDGTRDFGKPQADEQHYDTAFVDRGSHREAIIG